LGKVRAVGECPWTRPNVRPKLLANGAAPRSDTARGVTARSG
jgi:hypothetical protein